MSERAAPVVDWVWGPFSTMTSEHVYDFLRLRQQVFVIEQECVFLDTDDRDQRAWHLLGYAADDRLLAYLRVFAPGDYYPEAAIGRVVSAPCARGQGLGRTLMQRGIDCTLAQYPGATIRIGAQRRLMPFYQSLGFVVASDEYLEDGIVHIEMCRRG